VAQSRPSTAARPLVGGSWPPGRAAGVVRADRGGCGHFLRRPAQAGANGADRYLQRAGDVGVGHVGPGEQEQHVPVAGPQAGQDPGRLAGAVGAGVGLREGLSRGRILGGRRPVPQVSEPLPPLAPGLRAQQVVRDAVQPGPGAVAVRPVGGAPGERRQEHLGGQVGALGRPGPPAQVLVQLGVVPVEDPGECRRVGPRSRDQLAVGLAGRHRTS
jgi:hypothetical protein